MLDSGIPDPANRPPSDLVPASHPPIRGTIFHGPNGIRAGGEF